MFNGQGHLLLIFGLKIIFKMNSKPTCISDVMSTFLQLNSSYTHVPSIERGLKMNTVSNITQTFTGIQSY